jgi:hypothetical protein
MAIEKVFFSKHWHVITWTFCYVLVMWLVLRGLFNFNMFSAAHLSRLARVELHGFAGLVFGILILAAVPLYIATTVLVARNKSVPFRIPLPKCFAPLPEPEPEPAPTPVVVEQEVLPELPAGVPAEMRESFMRARKNYGVRQMSVFNRPGIAPIQPGTVPPNTDNVIATANTTVSDTVSESTSFPIPDDFDIDTPDNVSDVPVFSDINFDTDDNDENSDSDLQKYLTDSGIEFKTSGNLIIANNFAIAVHDDDDFWVPDDIDWFAAGRQKPSPIVELLHARENDKNVPVFLVTSDNIIDFEQNVQKWRNDGITIVTNCDELLNVIKNQTNN